jgi:transcription elongation factor GreA
MNADKRFPLTQEAYDRVLKELRHRESDKREEIVNAISTARAHGDLSENAEYHAAREQQGQNEAKIRQLRQKIENADIIEVSNDDVVAPGKLVTIRYDGDEEAETYLLGDREEKGGEYDVLTPDSPLGRALMGRSSGEALVAEVPAGALKIEVIRVRAP